MASGTPVITTKLPGIPPKYWKYLIALDDESVSGLSRLIKQLSQTPYSKYQALGQRARQFVMNEKHEVVQGGSVAVFLRELI